MVLGRITWIMLIYISKAISTINNQESFFMSTKTQLSSRFKQVFYNTGVGIMIVDKDRTLIEVNPKFCETLGYTEKELIGKSAEMIHISSASYKDFGERAFNQVRQKKTVNLEWPFKTKNGAKIWFRIAGDPVAEQTWTQYKPSI